MIDMGEPPLIVGPHRICSSELMGLLLKGVASGNFGAQNATNTAGNDWPPGLGTVALGPLLFALSNSLILRAAIVEKHWRHHEPDPLCMQ